MIPAFSSSNTCSFIASCLMSPRCRLACTTGFASSETFSRCSAICRGTPTISAGVQANTSMLSCSNFFSAARVRSDIAGPRVTVCSGYALFNTHFSASMRGAGLLAFAGRISSVASTSLLAYIKAMPVLVGKPMAECGAEQIMLKSPCDSLPRRMSCLECAGSTMNVTSSVFEFLPSESNTGNDICPRGKTASLQKPVSG
ncbi:hypothetical protein HanPI659440_Chr14g0564391 [Helianthus annuus]|nr:hypothetical protein HanPI659440_Chr14g0564391 [Helianthus annuus]